jgi:branched-subunit amino acid ABC-type transport system permease component
MNEFLPFVVAGLTSGSLIALAAMSLVLIYKTAGVFNFAQGAAAAAAAYLFYQLHTVEGLHWALAGAICVFVAAPAAGVVLEWLTRGLADAPPVARIVGTIGTLVAIQGLLVLQWGSTTINTPVFLPSSTFSVGGTFVSYDQLVGVLVALIAAVGLSVFFKVSRVGTQMRAVVDDPLLIGFSGTSPNLVRRQAWVIGMTFTAVAGILIAPSVGLDPSILTLLVVQAFGAAALGRFQSLSLTYLGALITGVGSAIATKYAVSHAWLSGASASLPFVLLIAVLIFSRGGRFVEVAGIRLPKPPRFIIPGRAVYAGRLLLLAVAVIVPFIVGAKLPVWTSAMIFVLIFQALSLLLDSGQVSLAHAGLAAIGASTFGHLSDHGVPYFFALLAAGGLTALVGAIVSIPAIRLSGLYLALATFGLGLTLQYMVFSTFLMFGSTGSLNTPRPAVLGLDSDRGFYFLCLGICAMSAVVLLALRRSRLGRLLRAIGDSPTALSAQGASVMTTHVIAFSLSAFIAGIAGALYGSLNLTLGGAPFAAFVSLTWLTTLFICRAGSLTRPILAAVLTAVAPAYVFPHSNWYGEWSPVLFGLAALGAALQAGGGISLGRFGTGRRRKSKADDRGHRSGRQQTQPAAVVDVADSAVVRPSTQLSGQ